MQFFKKKAVRVFTVNKKNEWRDRLLRSISLFFISIVILGTLFWFLFSVGFSFEKFAALLAGKIKPEVNKVEEKKNLTREEELKSLIEEDKVLEIVNIEKTAQGDLIVKSKSNEQIVFAVKKNLTDQVSTLQTLLTKAKIDNKPVKRVDFRFDKIVVEY